MAQDDRPAAEGAAGAALLVWGLWVVMAVAGAYFVARCHGNFPRADEWEVVPYLTGRQPLDAASLWHPINEHRLPLVKVALAGLFRATGDFRAQTWANYALLAGVSAGMVRVAARLRGRPAYSDAFFPVALLHWGHVEFYMGQITLNHMLSMALAAGLLAAVVLRPGGLGRGGLLAVAGCVVALPLCGANGLPVVLTTAAWLAWAAGLEWRAGRRGRAAAHLAVGAAGVLLVWLYFRGLEPHAGAGAPSARAAVRVGAQALGMTCVGWNREWWPAAGYPVPAALAAGGLVAAAGAAWRWPAERLRGPGVLLFLAGSAAPAAAIGYARTFVGDEGGTALRYGAVLMPAVLAAYLSAVLYEGRAWRGFLPTALCLLAAAALPGRMQQGWAINTAVRNFTRDVLQDCQAGAPTDRFAAKYAGVMYPDAVVLESRLRDLNGTRYGPLAGLTVAEPERFTPVRVLASGGHGVTGGPARWTAAGPDPHQLVAIDPGRQPVRSLRIVWSVRSPQGQVVDAEVFWGVHGAGADPARRVARRVLADGVARPLVVPVDGPIEWYRFDPSNGPCEFEVVEVSTSPGP